MKSIPYVVFQLVTRSWLLLDQLIYGKIWYSQAWHKAFVLRVKMNCSLDNVCNCTYTGGRSYMKAWHLVFCNLWIQSKMSAQCFGLVNKVYMKEVNAEISLSRLYFWNLLGKTLTLRGL